MDLGAEIAKLAKLPRFSNFSVNSNLEQRLHKTKFRDMPPYPDRNYDCFADAVPKAEVQCICWDTEYKDGTQSILFYRCSRCQTLQHKTCVSQRPDEDEAELIRPYLCAQCQIKSLDRLSTPLVTLIKPF